MVAATWVVSRTVGLPAGVYAGIKLPVRFPDALATVLEAVIVVGAAALMARGAGSDTVRGSFPPRHHRGRGGGRRAGPRRRAGPGRRDPLVAGRERAGVTGPAAPGGGGDSSGGGTSGGGIPGY